MGNGAITKDRILQVALDIFAHHGFEGARMEKIASEVGINKASLYFHFKSKEDIFRELFHSILLKYRSKIKLIIVEKKDLPVKQRLTAIYKDYLKYNWNNIEMDFWNRMYYFPPEMMRDEIIQETIDAENAFVASLTGVFEEGIQKKDIRPGNANHMAKTYYYLLTCIGLSVDIMNQDQGLIDMENCFGVFWEGIKG